MIVPPTHNLIKMACGLAFAVLSSSGATHAAPQCKDDCPPLNRAADQNCASEKTPLTRCSSYSAYTVSNKKLNTIYGKVTKSVRKDDLPKLKGIQREWITWRDEKCEDVEDAANCTNGACAGVAHDSCIVDLTDQRTKELLGIVRSIQQGMSPDIVFSKQYPS